MRQPGSSANSNRAETISVLSISPLETDHAFLESILRHSNWMHFKANCVPAALSLMKQHEISVVLCESDLKPGRWTDVLDHIQDLNQPPALIVTSRLADERLWAEALNLGAWDVFGKPFDRSEVLRGIKTAWQHRRNQMHTPLKVMRVAS